MNYVAALWRRHVETGDSTTKIWNLLVLDEWLATHRDAWA
jgi:hypothetical protein